MAKRHRPAILIAVIFGTSAPLFCPPLAIFTLRAPLKYVCDTTTVQLTRDLQNGGFVLPNRMANLRSRLSLSSSSRGQIRLLFPKYDIF